MISDMTIPGGASVPASRQSDIILTAFDGLVGHTGTIQPVSDVQAYLSSRKPQPDIAGEECLLITLPEKLQADVRALCRACKYALGLVKDGCSVAAACQSAFKLCKRLAGSVKTFRAKFDLWWKAKDWVVLVNFAKAPACWRTLQSATMPEEFLKFVEQRFGAFKRSDGKRQALMSIKRQWVTGRNDRGDEQIIPGYEDGWNKRDRENSPTGWSYSNIMRQIAARARFTKGVRALLHEGESAARAHLPQVLGTRRGLRFLEKITFDDVRMDWLVFNAETGQAEELWLLVARDEATAMVLGFVMHPATVREDGTASHLGARQMKELAAYLLERYPLPPYTVHWVVERGTATLAEGVKAALGELFNDRIKVSYTSMIGTQSPAGYREKAKGNSRGKASHEAHNRLFHTQASSRLGQIGADYSIRPADLDARVRESGECWSLRQRLPEAKRGDVRFPLTVLQTEAREVIRQYCLEQNFRTEHKLEDFQEVLEWFDGQKWQPAAAHGGHADTAWRKRMEMPVERAMRLIRSVEKWDRVDPSIVKTFLEHTQRVVWIEDNGEVKFTHEGKLLNYKNSGVAIPPGTKCLAYHHSDDPQFLHLTSGDGRILGTWCQRGRGAYLDQQALADAMRYTYAARESAKATAGELAAPEIAGLAEMRNHNAALEQFVVTSDVPTAIGMETGSAVATVLASTAAGQKTAKRAADRRDKNLREFKGEAADLVEEPSTINSQPSTDFAAEGLL